MKRFLCIAALFAVVLIPDWASACWPRWGRPTYDQPYAPMYRAPIFYRAAPPVYISAPPIYCEPVYGPPVYGPPVYVQPYAPMTQPNLPPPRVVPVKPKSDSSLPSPLPLARPEPAPPAQPDPVRPATGIRLPMPTAKPDPKPDLIPPTLIPTPNPKPETAIAPPPSEPKRGGLFVIPKNLTPEPKLPKLEEPKLPPLELPKNNTNPEPKLPSLELPKDPDPKLPSLELPGTAVPVPAPSPDVLTPPTGAPTPKNDLLPPLTLPPDSPVSPVEKSNEKPKMTEVKSSPLATATRELKVTVFSASGAATANAPGLRKIGFYNQTNRDLVLTIEGKAVTLPAMSYLHAHLPQTFTWKCADKPAAKETVPADGNGLDVVIRE